MGISRRAAGIEPGLGRVGSRRGLCGAVLLRPEWLGREPAEDELDAKLRSGVGAAAALPPPPAGSLAEKLPGRRRFRGPLLSLPGPASRFWALPTAPLSQREHQCEKVPSSLEFSFPRVLPGELTVDPSLGACRGGGVVRAIWILKYLVQIGSY